MNEPTPGLSLTKQALLAVEELQARLAVSERARREPIAIVGVGLRLPGGATDRASFWRLLRDGADAVTEVPPDRWDVEAYFDPDPAAAGKTYTRAGGFIGDVDRFDAEFFGIAPREARSLDPQHRLLLEVAWEALEDAGRDPESLAGSRTGVFVGITLDDYLQLQVRRDDPEAVNAYTHHGSALNAAAGRVSFTLGLRGPSLAIDTACSSSLVAVHLACQSLRGRECDLALAGGVSLMLSPLTTVRLARGRMLAPDGRCKTFDAAADGYGRGEGCGLVVLKRLSDAVADGDTVLALVRGSAVNQDGRSSGLTVPNGLAQQEVIRGALAAAGVRPAEVSYVEAHGTGTSLGDPIEVEALAAVLGEGRAKGRPLAIGSVKTNIGHCEAAAGVAGLIKVVLALEHGAIPAHLHFRTPNPHIAWSELPVIVPTRLTAWAPGGTRRVAGVSAFGASGTNAHVVVEEAPTMAAAGGVERPRQVVTLSAKSEAALAALAGRYAGHLEARPELALRDVAYTANAGRAQFGHRLAAAAGSVEELRGQLAAVARRETPAGVQRGQARGSERPAVALLFTGQGAQYVGMGRELYETEPVFRAAVERCAAGLAGELEVPLLEVLYGGWGRRIDETAYAQPALFAVEWGLAELWRSWGLEPAVVLGHSVGEYVAACVAGVLEVDAAVRLVAARGRLMGGLPGDGAMVAVEASEDRVGKVVRKYRGRVWIAGVNGPGQVVVSGARELMTAVGAELRAAGLAAQELKVSHAFHSALMEPMVGALVAAARGVEARAPRMGWISTVTGEVVRGAPGAEYWGRQAREAVQWWRGVERGAREGVEVWVEAGPQPVLTALGRQSGVRGTWVGTLQRGRGEWEAVLEAAGAVWVRGVGIDWARVAGGSGGRKVALPTYPFQRERFWFEDAGPARPRDRARLAAQPSDAGDALHPLLGRRLRSAASIAQFETTLAVTSPAFLSDHRVLGAAVLPATAYVAQALAAATAALGPARYAVEDLVLEEPLVIPENAARVVQAILTPDAQGGGAVEVFSAEDAGAPRWRRHARALVTRAAGAEPRTPADVAALRARCSQRVDADAYYRDLGECGLAYGPTFQGVEELWRRDGEALARIRVADAVAGGGAYALHPATLDACMQPVLAALPRGGAAAADVTYLPLRIGRAEVLRRPTSSLWSHVVLHPSPSESGETVTADVRVVDDAGAPVAEIEMLALRRAGREWLRQRDALDGALYALEWLPKPLAPAGRALTAAGRWSPSRIARAVAPGAGEPDERYRLARYAELVRELDAACLAYVARAFRRLGVDLAEGRSVPLPSLVSEAGIAERHRRLFGRMLDVLAEERCLEETPGGWQVRRAPGPADDPRDRLSRLLEAHPDCREQLLLLMRCGEQLPAVLRGGADPLQLLFPGGSLAPLEQLYEASPFARLYNGLMARMLRAAVDARGERPLRILEIGAGTGGTTASLLPVLPADRTEYVFTDVSPVFLGRAQAKFAAYPFVRYALLDVESDPAAQGFAGRRFDLVVAANVVHATADLRRTLVHARELLAGDGLLMLLEGTGPQRWVDLTFGMTEGWWKFTDTELRPRHPLLSPAGWRALLPSLGFREPVTLPDVERGEGDGWQIVVMAGGPSREPDLAASAGPRRTWAVLADDGGVGAALAERLRARGDRCEVVRCRERDAGAGRDERDVDPARPEDFEALWSRLQAAGEVHGVVHLWSADAGVEPTAAALARSCASTLHLVQAVARGGGAPRLWLVTRGAHAVEPGAPVSAAQAPVLGLGRAIAQEHPELRCVRVDLDPDTGAEQMDALLAELDAGDDEDEVALRGGGRHVGRLAPWRNEPLRRLAVPEAEAVALEIGQRGVLDRLAIRAASRRAPGPGDVEIRVAAAGLNFRDVLNALGVYPGDAGPLGGECAGEVVAVGAGVDHLRAGDAVVAVGPGAFRSFVTLPAALVAPRPAGLGVEEAATIPVAFVTAAWTLRRLARLKPGERVLIHAAAGGVGLAAVQVAQRAGAEIFATAGSPAKRERLRRLGVAHVMDSRTLDFADEVADRTGGRGVDVVLNALAGPFIERSLTALASHGRFVEIGKTDIWDAGRMAAARPDVTYFPVDLGAVLAESPPTLGALLAGLMAEFAAGALRPLPWREFAVDDAAAAFRHMAQARHVGKILLTGWHPRAARTRCVTVRDDATYLVTGGLRGLGLLVARWLVERGARHLVLMGRSAPAAPASAVLEELRAQARVEVVRGDVACAEDVGRVFDVLAERMPPLRGIVHAAGTLDDGVLLQQDWARFARVLAPKVAGTWLLHSRTRTTPLDFFVLFSSTVSLLGRRGQANHAAANAYLDAMAHHRRASGLVGLSVNWGPWTDAGAAVERGALDRLLEQGMEPVTPETGLRLLESLIASEVPQVAVLPLEWSRFRRQLTEGREPPLLSAIGRGRATPVVEAAPAASPDLTSELRETPPGRRRDVLASRLREQAARTLGLAPAQIADLRRPLNELGLDSLMAVELRNAIGRMIGRTLPATLLFDYPSVHALADHLAAELPAGGTAAEPPAPPGAAADRSALDAVAELSDDEATALLLAELDDLKEKGR